MVDRVVLHPTARAHGQQSGPLELRQVARNRRLGDPETADDLLGVKFVAPEQVQDAQTVGIGVLCLYAVVTLGAGFVLINRRDA